MKTHLAIAVLCMLWSLSACALAGENNEVPQKYVVHARNNYNENNALFQPKWLGGEGTWEYKDVDGVWQPLCKTSLDDWDINVPGMTAELTDDKREYYRAGEYGDERFVGRILWLVGTPQFTGTGPHKGYVIESETSNGETTRIVRNYDVYVDDAYDEYTNSVAVYPALVNQTARGDYEPGEFAEGWISVFGDTAWPEAGDVYVVQNSVSDTTPTPRGIYRLDVENTDAAALNELDVRVTYYHTNGRRVLGEETYLVDKGSRTFYVGEFPGQQQYEAYKIVIRVSAELALGAGRYRLRIGRTKPLVLVHGIRSYPHDQDDVRNGNVFCDDLHLILESNYYCKCYFLCHDTGRDAINEVLYGYRDRGRTGYYQLVEHCYTEHGTAAKPQPVTIFAHSEGAALTRLYANSWPTYFRTYVGSVITAGGVHLGSAFASAWWDIAMGPLASLAGCTIETKNILEIGGPVSLYNNQFQIPASVKLVALNGDWGTHPESYMNSIIQASGRWLPRHFTYGEIDRVYRNASDGMVPHFSACPAAPCTSGLLAHGGGVAHDLRGTARGPNTETHVSWQNYREHPTYKALVALLFGGGQAELLAVPQNIGVVMLPGISRAYLGAVFGSVYSAWQGGVKRGELWWQDKDDDLTIASITYRDHGQYLFMGTAGAYDIMRRERKDVYTCVYHYEYGWSGRVIGCEYLTNTVNTNVYVDTCEVQGGRLLTHN